MNVDNNNIVKIPSIFERFYEIISSDAKFSSDEKQCFEWTNGRRLYFWPEEIQPVLHNKPITIILKKKHDIQWPIFCEMITDRFKSFQQQQREPNNNNNTQIQFLPHVQLVCFVDILFEHLEKLFIPYGIPFEFIETTSPVTLQSRINKPTVTSSSFSSFVRQTPSHALQKITSSKSKTNVSNVSSVCTPMMGKENENVTCIILDSGVNRYHPDIKNKLHKGKSFCPGTPWDQDTIGHGTEITGLICGNLTGVSSCLEPIIYKVFDQYHTTSSFTILQALDFILSQNINNKTLFHKNVVVNCSFTSRMNHAINLSFEKLIQSGATIVVAAGNNNKHIKHFSPLSISCVNNNSCIIVGSTDEMDHYSSFSNYGENIKLYAPGNNVLVASKNNTYGYASGTSYSAAFVCGAVCLLKSYSDKITNNNVLPYLVNVSQEIRQTNIPLLYCGERLLENIQQHVEIITTSDEKKEKKEKINEQQTISDDDDDEAPVMLFSSVSSETQRKQSFTAAFILSLMILIFPILYLCIKV